METNYTKAPWAWQLFGDTYMLTAQHGNREIIIGAIEAPVFNHPVPAMNNNGRLEVIDKNHPNAKLIAAAPQMLEALLLVVDNFPKEVIYDQLNEYGARVYEAIEKATK